MDCKYSRSQVNAAGLVIREDRPLSDPEMDDALNVLGAWRSTQAYPLQVAYMKLRERAKKVDAKTIVSQRLKRVPSIIIKLQRQPGMQLARMQDIGGCRAVVEDMKAVAKLTAQYGSPQRDYIAQPKPDGYRSVHFIDPYEPSDLKYELLSGRKTEVQVRTKLQHAWATAVETVDSILGQRLKTGGGDHEWKRLFALASGYIAHKEKSPCVPGTPNEPGELKRELKELVQRLDVLKRLEGMSAGVNIINAVGPSFHKIGRHKIEEFILVLDISQKRIIPHGFTASMMPSISGAFLDLEKKHFGDPNMQVVQVKVGTARNLKKAYPNYYLSAQAFLSVLREVI
jgi:putative GTP pyrophosphokinase